MRMMMLVVPNQVGAERVPVGGTMPPSLMMSADSSSSAHGASAACTRVAVVAVRSGRLLTFARPGRIFTAEIVARFGGRDQYLAGRGESTAARNLSDPNAAVARLQGLPLSHLLIAYRLIVQK